MSTTFRLLKGALSLPLVSSKRSCLPGILGSGNVSGLIQICSTVSQRDLHQSCLSEQIFSGNTRKSWLVNQKSCTLASTSKLFRLYSSQAEDVTLGQLVYQGRNRNMFKAVKIFSLSTSAIALSLQPFMVVTYQDMSLVAAVPFFTLLNVFVFLNPALIHFISKKYITDLYFNHDTKVFTAYLLSFFARREAITFTAADVDVPDVPSPFSILTVKGRPLFVLETDFKNIDVYKHLMRFDQPLDLTYFYENKKDSDSLHENKKD